MLIFDAHGKRALKAFGCFGDVLGNLASNDPVLRRVTDLESRANTPRLSAPDPIAQAISTSCCSGIESVRTSASGEIAAPTRASNSRARVRRAAQSIRRHAPEGSSRRPMFSATVRSANNAGC